MNSRAIFTVAFLLCLQQWPQVSGHNPYDTEEYGYKSKSCLNYEKCCYEANDYYYKCVAAASCSDGDPYYCEQFYDTCSTSMRLDAPAECKVCLCDYYYKAAGEGCACCTDTNYCDSFDYKPKPYYD